MRSEYITERELNAHLERIGDYMESTDQRLSRIETRLDARPALRWMRGRATHLLDQGLTLALACGAGVAIAHLF